MNRKKDDPTPEEKREQERAWRAYQKALSADKRRQEEVMDKLQEQMKDNDTEEDQ